MNTHIIGVSGEKIAVDYLKKHKYKVVQQNYRCQFGEIDVIAKDGKYLVFLEVKSRSGTQFGLPREAVDTYKQQTIIKCATLYLAQNNLTGCPVRFDVVEVLQGQVTLIKDAFRIN